MGMQGNASCVVLAPKLLLGDSGFVNQLCLGTEQICVAREIFQPCSFLYVVCRTWSPLVPPPL